MISLEKDKFGNADLPDEDEEDVYRLIPNLVKQAQFFEQAGVGLPREEFIRVSIAMRELVESWPIESLRFWGKILGTRKNYYVVEAEFKDGEYESDLSDDEGEDDKSSNDKVRVQSACCWLHPSETASAIKVQPPTPPLRPHHTRPPAP